MPHFVHKMHCSLSKALIAELFVLLSRCVVSARHLVSYRRLQIGTAVSSRKRSSPSSLWCHGARSLRRISCRIEKSKLGLLSLLASADRRAVCGVMVRGLCAACRRIYRSSADWDCCPFSQTATLLSPWCSKCCEPKWLRSCG